MLRFRNRPCGVASLNGDACDVVENVNFFVVIDRIYDSVFAARLLERSLFRSSEPRMSVLPSIMIVEPSGS